MKKKQAHLGRRVFHVIVGLLVAGIVIYASLIAWVCYREANVPSPSDYDSMIVLGAQVLPSGEPSVQLRWRLDQALSLYQQSPCPVVVCGAQAGQEPAPEGTIMKALLEADGVPPEDVYADATSTNTKENMKNAKAILDQIGCTKPLVVTSDYHLPRAMAIAKDVGFEPQGSGSKCRPEFQYWLQNHAREALAWVKYWLTSRLGLSL